MNCVVTFDLDGVLIDTRLPNIEAFQSGFAQMELPVPSGEEIASLIGIPALSMLERLGCPGERATFMYDEYVRPAYLSLLPTMGKEFHGAREVLGWLRNEGFTLVAVTAGTREVQEPLLRHLGFSPYFHGVITASDSSLSKPDPDLLRSSLSSLNLPSAQVYLVDDGEEGILMGNLFGARTVHAAYGYGKLREAVPTFTISHIAEMKEILAPVKPVR